MSGASHPTKTVCTRICALGACTQIHVVVPAMAYATRGFVHCFNHMPYLLCWLKSRCVSASMPHSLSVHCLNIAPVMQAMKSMKIMKCMRRSSLSSNSKASKSAGSVKASTRPGMSMKARVVSQRWNKQFKMAMMKYMKDTKEYQLVRRHLCFHRNLKAQIVQVFQEHHPKQWVGVMFALQE